MKEIDAILNRAKDYHKNNKELLKEKAKNKYRELSEEEENVTREYGRNRYLNKSEENKQRLKEYQRNYREARKHLSYMQKCISKLLSQRYFLSALLTIFKR